MKRPVQAQFTAYQEIFDYFNNALFDNTLPECILSFIDRRQSSRTIFSATQWRLGDGSYTPEISVNLDQIAERKPIEVMAALVRQMVHLWQDNYGNPSERGYYNREWADKMEQVGLVPSSSGEPGGKRTGNGIGHYVMPGGNFEQVLLKMPRSYLSPFWPCRVDAVAGERFPSSSPLRAGKPETLAFSVVDR